ncbi:DUF3263 domain-containing protein [Salinispora sp. H7-4]|uniref:DUF3263 domain-containing protein n=1 Tax=Salinispora sp. H7-4 TaxID=2748321 RepID=UPI0015D41DDB|nr:DUF3263 domain-containing protein [Salinispora sp. H7-4]NYT96743.1 DUF3263 domain-containing protein [Salinispora sp. H7-4]
MPPDTAPTAAEPSGDGRPGDGRGRSVVPPPRPVPEVEAVASADPEPDVGSTVGLTGRERDILDFEQQWWRHPGAKEQAIRDRFGCTATRYYQLLNGLLDNPAALAAEPLLVGRLRRLRSARARDRRR